MFDLIKINDMNKLVTSFIFYNPFKALSFMHYFKEI